jgi:hypothetical protein
MNKATTQNSPKTYQSADSNVNQPNHDGIETSHELTFMHKRASSASPRLSVATLYRLRDILGEALHLLDAEDFMNFCNVVNVLDEAREKLGDSLESSCVNFIELFRLVERECEVFCPECARQRFSN